MIKWASHIWGNSWADWRTSLPPSLPRHHHPHGVWKIFLIFTVLMSSHKFLSSSLSSIHLTVSNTPPESEAAPGYWWHGVRVVGHQLPDTNLKHWIDCLHFNNFISSTQHLKQGVAAVAVGLLVVLHQAVQRAELQALVHQRATPRQTQGTELPLTH